MESFVWLQRGVLEKYRIFHEADFVIKRRRKAKGGFLRPGEMVEPEVI